MWKYVGRIFLQNEEFPRNLQKPYFSQVFLINESVLWRHNSQDKAGYKIRMAFFINTNLNLLESIMSSQPNKTPLCPSVHERGCCESWSGRMMMIGLRGVLFYCDDVYNISIRCGQIKLPFVHSWWREAHLHVMRIDWWWLDLGESYSTATISITEAFFVAK